MGKKKERDCTKCIAYLNFYKGGAGKCGLGFDVEEDMEKTKNGIRIVVRPYEKSCYAVDMPATKEDFVRIAAELGDEWDINDVNDRPGILQVRGKRYIIGVQECCNTCDMIDRNDRTSNYLHVDIVKRA